MISLIVQSLMIAVSLFTLYVMILYPLYRITIDLWDDKLKKGGN